MLACSTLLFCWYLASAQEFDAGIKTGKPVPLASDGVEVADLDAAAAQYVRQQEAQAGVKVEWFDLYGRQPHLLERPQYHKYKVTLWSDDVTYGQVTKTVERPGYVYTQWFHNAQSVPLVTEFHRTVELRSVYTWSISSSVKVNAEIKATAGIPDYLGVNAYFNSTIDLQEHREQTKHETEKYAVKNIVTIPPRKSVKAEFVVTEKDVVVPWEADVEIDGWVAMWFKDKVEGHWLWFHPIVYVRNRDFPMTADGKRLTHLSKGNFRGLRGVDTVLRTYEYDLQVSNSVPVKVSDLKPNLQRLW